MLIVLLLIKPFQSNGLNLPSSEFIQEFAMMHDLNYIFIYLPNQLIPKQIITDYCKNKSPIEIAIKCITSKHLENTDRLIFQNQDLHVFIPNEDAFLEGFEIFKRIFNNRKRSRKEYWLLNIFSYLNDSKQLLEDLYLDLDDDLYLFENKSILGQSYQDIMIFETYRLQDKLPSKFNYYAKWSHEEKHLDILKSNKWERRKDLTGVKFRCSSWVAAPYIQKVIPKSNETGEYLMTGFFADVFATLKVIL